MTARATLALELLVQRRCAALCGDPARWEHLTRAPAGEGETLHGGVGPIMGGEG